MPKQRHGRPSRRHSPKPATPARPGRARSTGPAKRAKPARSRQSLKPTKTLKSRRTVGSAKTAEKGAVARARARSPRTASPAVSGPSPHERAVALFERGFQALQERQFGRAAGLLTSVVNEFADEKELQERARVFLAVCERKAGTLAAQPRSFEERLNAAVVAINRGAFGDGLALLHQLEGEAPDNDHVQYLLSVSCAWVGNLSPALAHLHRAIELAPENRFRAAQDPDLEPLRQDQGFAAIEEALPRRRRLAVKKR
jgi:predicted Zn-dependent protease